MENPTIAIGLLLITISCLFIATPTTHAAAEYSDEDDVDGAWIQTICRGGDKRPTTTLHFYVHDVRTGQNATLYTVANSSITATSPTGFGRVNVFDDRVTAGPSIKEKEVGRAQGTTVSSDLQVTAYTMTLNFYLTSGRYQGSTVSIVGRNQFADKQRELTVVGGTGALRYARGYAITKTYSHDAAINYSVLEYTIYLKLSGLSGCSAETS